MARGQSVYQGQYSFPVRSTVEQSLARSAQAQAQMYGSLGESIGKVASAYFEKKNEKDQIKALAKREDIRAMVFRGQPMPTDEKEIEKAVAATYKGLGGTLGVENMLFRQQAEQRAQQAEQRQVETFERFERKERGISDYFKAISAKRGGTGDVSLEERQPRGTLGEAAKRLGGDLLDPEAWKEASGRLGHPLSERSAEIARLSPSLYRANIELMQQAPLAEPAELPLAKAPAAQGGMFLKDAEGREVSVQEFVELRAKHPAFRDSIRDAISDVFSADPEIEQILEDDYSQGRGLFPTADQTFIEGYTGNKDKDGNRIPTEAKFVIDYMADLRDQLGRTPRLAEVEKALSATHPQYEIPNLLREFYQSDKVKAILGDEPVEIIERPAAAPAAQPTYLGGMMEQAGEAMGRLGDVQLPERVTRRTTEGQPGRSLLERRQGMTQPSYLEAFMLENPNATTEMMEIALKDAASLPARAPQELEARRIGPYSMLIDPVTKKPISESITTTAGAKPTFEELREIEETGIKLQDATNDMGRMFKIFQMDAEGRPTGEVDKWLVGPDIANKTSRWLQDKGFTQWQSDELIDNRDFLEQFVNENVISESARLSGSISEGELKILRNTAPTLNSSPKIWREYLNKINATLQRETKLNNRLRGVLGGGGYGGGLGAAGGGPQVNPMQAKTSAQIFNTASSALGPNPDTQAVQDAVRSIQNNNFDPAIKEAAINKLRDQYPDASKGVTSATFDPTHHGSIQKIEGFEKSVSGQKPWKTAIEHTTGGKVTGGYPALAIQAMDEWSGDMGILGSGGYQPREGSSADVIPTGPAIRKIPLEGKPEFMRILANVMKEGFSKKVLNLDDFKGDKKAWYGKHPDPLHPHNFNVLVDYAIWSMNEFGGKSAARDVYKGDQPNLYSKTFVDYLVDFTEQMQARTGDLYFGDDLTSKSLPRMKQALNPKSK